jgi:hypothetical protein
MQTVALVRQVKFQLGLFHVLIVPGTRWIENPSPRVFWTPSIEKTPLEQLGHALRPVVAYSMRITNL